MTATIPSPRDLLTSLISSLPSIPIAKPNNTTTKPTAADHIPSHRSSNQHTNPPPPPSNPFKLIPPAYRPILTTLHVLYPSTLLPALDLLDRRLVTRVILTPGTSHIQHNADIQRGQSPTISSHEPSQAEIKDDTPSKKQAAAKSPPLYHLVRSAQQPSHRRHHHHHHAQNPFHSGQAYIVRLASWNCTCAAFAFSAFPPLPTFSSTASASASGYRILPATAPAPESGDTAEPGITDMDVDMDGAENTGEPWEFGGLSADGRDGAGGVPCCKHLLACVLAERWDAVLGAYVEERLVSREESAGLVGDL
ncbi:hypothetical protein F5Y14DRAFT_297369 [Nemania sp. NC0429]|nr:hypothetical protein F5Y14DRAFT_297369 [Nemania sp. NC0429]